MISEKIRFVWNVAMSGYDEVKHILNQPNRRHDDAQAQLYGLMKLSIASV